MSTIQAQAFWITGRGQGEIRAEHLTAPQANEVLVETAFTAVSRGTEALVFNQRVPETEYERMRAPFQSGNFPAPVKYGYANVGRVAEGPAEFVGQDVFSLFPHQSRYVVPTTAVTMIPEEVPPARAVLAANLETAVNAMWDASVAIGDRVAVVGAGTVGCLVAWIAARLPGCKLELIDIDARKIDVAEALGISFKDRYTATGNADVVIHASGTAAGLDTALSLAGFEATVLELSWYGAGEISAALGGRFHSHRLQLKASQVSAIAASQRARWDHARRMSLVMELLKDPALDALITGESPFDKLPDVMTQLSNAESGALCHRITYL